VHACERSSEVRPRGKARRSKDRMLGTVIVPDAETALEVALAEFNIPSVERRRIVVVQTVG
jgi:hypothetical protein